MRQAAALALAMLAMTSGLVVPEPLPGLFGTYPASWFHAELPVVLGGASPPSPTAPAAGTGARAEPEWVTHIIARLQYKVTLIARGESLGAVADSLARLLGLTVILSPKARDEGRGITVDISSMRGILALNWVCRLADAGWEIRDEAVYVFLRSERPTEDRVLTPAEILDILERVAYRPPDFAPPPDPFGFFD